MQKSKYAFTMIEMVFVIVVLGILAAIAIPRLAATRIDAQITKGHSDVASIRAAIVSERQSRLIKGESGYISQLHETGSEYYFDGNGSSELLMYGIKAEDADGHWHGQGTSGANFTYKFKLLGVDTTFDYNVTTGKFTCTAGSNYCNKLVD